MYNQKLRKDRSVVENTFGIIKYTFQELLIKSDLDLKFLLDVINCCCLLYNMVLEKPNCHVEYLFDVLEEEATIDKIVGLHKRGRQYRCCRGDEEEEVEEVEVRDGAGENSRERVRAYLGGHPTKYSTRILLSSFCFKNTSTSDAYALLLSLLNYSISCKKTVIHTYIHTKIFIY